MSDPRLITAVGSLPIPPRAFLLLEGQSFQTGQVVHVQALVRDPSGRYVDVGYDVNVAASLNFPIQAQMLPAGELVSAVVSLAGGVVQGVQVWVRLTLTTNDPNIALPFSVVCCGWIGAHSSVSWPGGVNTTAQTDAGPVGECLVQTPSAGAEVSFTMGGRAVKDIVLIRYTLTTSATVSNRTTQLRLTTPNGGVWNLSQAATQAASLSIVYNWAVWNAVPIALGTNVNILLPPMSIPAGSTFATNTANLQAGDQYTNFSVIGTAQAEF